MLNRYSPKIPAKIRNVPKFTASDFFRKSMKEVTDLPEKVIMVYSKPLFQIIVDEFKLQRTEYPYDGFFDQCIDSVSGTGLIRLYPGAPLTAATVEELAALGTKKFLILGTAGSINEKAHFNDIVVCTRALRDEGTSYHYMKPTIFAYPTSELTQNLFKWAREAGIKVKRGSTWTTDAPYMETVREINEYRKRGILTVEMEASALFAVCDFRKLESAAVFSVSDELHDEEWTGINHPFDGFRNLAMIAGLFMKL